MINLCILCNEVFVESNDKDKLCNLCKQDQLHEIMESISNE